MSVFQKELYTNLMNLLVTNPNSFKYTDTPLNDGTNAVFRIFNYDIPKHSEFQQPGALDCRGTMFYVNGDDVKLLALPMKKFFSLGETPETRNVDFTKAKHVYLKADGSLLTSYISPIDNSLKFKSKNMPTFLNYELVEQAISPELKAEIDALTRTGISVDLELTTPKNRVFIEYDTYSVHVLKARDLNTGEYVDIRSDDFKAAYPVITANLIKRLSVSDIDIYNKFIEGYVIETDDNHSMYKVKTIPYLSMSAVVNIQDRSKEGEAIYRAAINEMLDEVRSLYHYRTHSPNFPIKEILARLDEVEDYARKSYRYLVHASDKFFNDNKDLERGDFARKAKAELPDFLPFLIEKYLGRPVNYKEAAIRIYGKKKKEVPDIDMT